MSSASIAKPSAAALVVEHDRAGRRDQGDRDRGERAALGPGRDQAHAIRRHVEARRHRRAQRDHHGELLEPRPHERHADPDVLVVHVAGEVADQRVVDEHGRLAIEPPEPGGHEHDDRHDHGEPGRAVGVPALDVAAADDDRERVAGGGAQDGTR